MAQREGFPVSVIGTAREKDDRHFQPPSQLKSGRERWQWTEDIILDGERWLQAQPFWTDLVKAEEIIKGKEMDRADENRSSLTSNRLKRIGREMVATCADVRYPADIWTSDNAAYNHEQEMFSKWRGQCGMSPGRRTRSAS